MFICTGITPSVAVDNVKKPSMPISNGKTLYVGGTGEDNYSSIQDAIDDSSDGDTVFVFDDSSPYVEKVIINVTINLVGEDKNTTVILGNWFDGVVNIFADRVSISGFTICNNAIGIYINSNFNIINNNIIEENYDWGIAIYGFSNNTIIGNTIRNNIKHGIWLSGYENPCCSNIIMGNNISNNNYLGISLYKSSNNTITDNKIISNNDGGIEIHDNHDNVISSNNIILNNEFGICLRWSKDNIITDNNISNNDYGIQLWYNTNYNIITCNNISNNENGILLKYSTSNNNIYNNNFLSNENNSYNEGNNTWDDGKYGNYWTDYEEKYPDAKKKPLRGIWDTPYDIEGGNNKDNFPLIRQWPNSKPRTKTSNNLPNFNLLDRLFNRYPFLEVFLRAMNMLR